MNESYLVASCQDPCFVYKLSFFGCQETSTRNCWCQEETSFGRLAGWTTERGPLAQRSGAAGSRFWQLARCCPGWSPLHLDSGHGRLSWRRRSKPPPGTGGGETAENVLTSDPWCQLWSRHRLSSCSVSARSQPWWTETAAALAGLDWAQSELY